MSPKPSRKTPWSRRFVVSTREPLRLAAHDADAAPGVKDKQDARTILHDVTTELRTLQRVLYAQANHALLVVLQAMDTGGKDGAIRHVFGPLNPQGVRVHNFKVPTAEEQAHDYLWRIHNAVPARGMIGVFNRSHYEDVLVTRVRKLFPRHVINQRYDQINAFEKHLTENGVTVLKFFLHISKDEQKRRLEARLENPDKHWKFSAADLSERKLWPAYVRAYEKALTTCNTPWAPWHIIPADRKWYRNLAIAQIVKEALIQLELSYPAPEPGLEGLRID